MPHKLLHLFNLLIPVFILAGCARIEKPLYNTPLPSVSAHQPLSGTPSQPAIALPLPSQEDPYLDQRLSMVNETIESRGVVDPDVLRAMSSVPRDKFVPPDYLGQAYEDHPLPIGFGQTISQPYIVAWMTELIELKAGEKVLEIGTGSGYQAAILAELGNVDVYSIEIVPELAESANERLNNLGYTKIHLKQGDGYYGWPEDILFNAIIVTAAPDHVPAPLVAQLIEGGRLVIPIGPPGGFQTLWKFVKQQGELKAYNLGQVSFVPLTGKGAKQAPIAPQH
jgi:protein-L-isoaspartate(D-aspartate) O-methyltransferase